MDKSIVQFRYCNHRNEFAVRTVRPIRIWFGSTAHHPEPGWLLEGFDLDRLETRDYAMSGILAPWQTYDPGAPMLAAEVQDGEVGEDSAEQAGPVESSVGLTGKIRVEAIP